MMRTTALALLSALLLVLVGCFQVRTVVTVRPDAVATFEGAGFTVLAFPELIRFDDYPYAAILELLRDYCRDEEIQLVDLLPALSKYEDHELWVHETDHHPNRVAHAIAARELLAGLDPVLPAATP